MNVIEERDPRLFAVTGGGAGIGRAISRGLAADGYKVAVLGRTRAGLEETVGDHPNMHPVTVDVADAAQCQDAMDAAAAHFEMPVDGLVACAAIYPKVHFLDQDPQSFTDTVMINICGVANAVRPILPGMLDRNLGRIIVLGSLADMNPIPTALAYSASKGGLHGLIKGLAAEVDQNRYPNVLINELIPGVIKTSMSEDGADPSVVIDYVRAQIGFPPGGPNGRCFFGTKELHLGESWKGTIKRVLLRQKK